MLDIDAARREALKDVEDVKRQNFATLDNYGWAKWSIEICDAEGTVLAVVPFSEN